MQKVSFDLFRIAVGPRCARRIAVWTASLLIASIALIVLPGASESLSAQGQKLPANPVATVKPHDPLGNKECSECHKRVASPNVNCLLAKKDLCDLCHQVPVEGGISRLVEPEEPVCAKCHDKSSFKGSFAHGPFAAGTCVACHDPHGGNVPGMLRVQGQQLCLQCHTDMSARITGAKYRHEAVSECLDCHSPHASGQQYMLTSSVLRLCGKCHEKTVRDQQMATVKHSPVMEESACMNCHDPHAAEESGLILADGIDVCLKCHDKPVKGKNQEFADMKQPLVSNPYPHGPIQNRDCSGCHDPHGSSNFRMLISQYPEGFYAPFFVSNYDLCFRCHDAALATEEHTAKATEFRDGDRNLHFVHVNRASHGRTCRSCHEVHASTNRKHVATTVPFGNWNLPVKFEQVENGGSCTPGCHAYQKYSRQAAKPDKR